MDRNIDDLPRSELEAIANAPIDAGEAPPRLSLVCVRCVRMRSQGYLFFGILFPRLFFTELFKWSDAISLPCGHDGQVKYHMFNTLQASTDA